VEEFCASWRSPISEILTDGHDQSDVAEGINVHSGNVKPTKHVAIQKCDEWQSKENSCPMWHEEKSYCVHSNNSHD